MEKGEKVRFKNSLLESWCYGWFLSYKESDKYECYNINAIHEYCNFCERYDWTEQDIKPNELKESK